MLDNRFFEDTRLELMVKPVFVTDGERKLRYANKAFSAFVKRVHITSTYKPDICEKLCGEDGLGLVSLHSGTHEKDFYAICTRVFGEKPVVCIDKEAKNDSFPTVFEDQLFIGLDTFVERISVPLFGGRIRKTPIADGAEHSNALSSAFEGVSDFGIKCVFIESVLESVVKSLSERLTASGFRIDADFGIHDNPVCDLSIFDASIVFELLMMVMLKSSCDRTVNVSLSASDDACRIVFAANCGNSDRMCNLRPEDVFDLDDPCGRVIASVMDLCELYSWKLICRTDKNGLALALSLPTCNSKTFKFANETDKSHEDVTKQVTSLLSGDIDYIINEK